jgi:hypothetical protein
MMSLLLYPIELCICCIKLESFDLMSALHHKRSALDLKMPGESIHVFMIDLGVCNPAKNMKMKQDKNKRGEEEEHDGS